MVETTGDRKYAIKISCTDLQPASKHSQVWQKLPSWDLINKKQCAQAIENLENKREIILAWMKELIYKHEKRTAEQITAQKVTSHFCQYATVKKRPGKQNE